MASLARARRDLLQRPPGKERGLGCMRRLPFVLALMLTDTLVLVRRSRPSTYILPRIFRRSCLAQDRLR